MFGSRWYRLGFIRVGVERERKGVGASVFDVFNLFNVFNVCG